MGDLYALGPGEYLVLNRRRTYVILDPSATMPFVVRIERGTRRYYFWFFGYVAKLPYERELP